MRTRSAVGAAALLAGGAVAVTAYAAYRAGGRRWRAGEEQLVAAGLSLPGDLQHHFVPTDDGGRLHAVERGSGPPVVLVHGVTLSAAVWVCQLRQLATDHRVIAVDMRGHGQSLAGAAGYAIDRLADDLLAVLAALEVRDAVLVGHSMGGMVALRLASRRPDELRAHVSSLVLMATAAGPVVYGPAHERTAALLAALARRGLRRTERLGLGVLPQGDVATWIARASFGARPLAADVELARSLTSAMPADALGELLATLLAFDVRRDVGTIDLPTRVVVGTRDLLTPPRMARALHRSIPRSTLVPLAGAGHMPMLERAREVNEILDEMSREAVPAHA